MTTRNESARCTKCGHRGTVARSNWELCSYCANYHEQAKKQGIPIAKDYGLVPHHENPEHVDYFANNGGSAFRPRTKTPGY